MQGWYPAAFEREMGCTEAELRLWLPGAVGHRTLEPLPGGVAVAVDGGRLVLRWAPLPDRRIALVRLPRLQVHFAFEGVDEAARQAFMRRFDLATQRGGG